MTEDAARYARVQEILLGARHLSDDSLHAYLDRECADDASLRARVLELLDAGTDEGTRDLFAEERVAQFRSRLESFFGETKKDWLPEEIGPYRVIRKIGQGGMGVVYEAEQPSPRRRVAIKLLHPMHATVDRLRRLTQEAELLGRLHHPGIAQIYEASTFDFGYGPQPYFAMELIDGVDLRTYCQRQRLDTDARIALLAQVADAIHSAHERGVIHRDLKPENILVDETGQPKVLDFGIAQTTEAATQMSTMGTQEGQLIGTLAYMAPEQLSPSEGEIRPLVDVFALGVTSFELLAGQLPREIEGLSITQAVARLVSMDAPRAGTIDPDLRGDVETVLGKALEPEADRRYRTAAAFAADLRRILAHEPIEARPPTRRYLAGKFVRRNRTLVGGTLATILALVAGTVISVVMANVARSQRDLANEREHFANNGVLQSAQYLVEAGRDREAERQLRLIPEEERGIAWKMLQRQVPQSLDLATAQMEFLGEDHLIGVNRTRQGLTVYSILDETSELRFPEIEIHAIFEVVGTRFIVVEGEKESCLLLDLESGQLIEQQPLEIATGTLDGTGQGFRQKRGLECDETGAIVLSHPDPQTAVIRRGEETWLTVSDLQFDESVHLGARGEIAVLNRREEILVVDLPSGAPRLRIAIPAGEIAKGIPVLGGLLFFEGPLLNCASHEPRLWRRVSLPPPGGPVDLVDPWEGAFPSTPDFSGHVLFNTSADGRRLLITRGAGLLADAEKGVPIDTSHLAIEGRLGPPGFVPRLDSDAAILRLSPSGERIVRYSGWGLPSIVEVTQDPRADFLEQPLQVLAGHRGAPGPNGEPGSVHPGWIYQFGLSTDGTLACSNAPLDPKLRLWDVRSGREIATLDRVISDPESWNALIAFAPDGNRVYVTTPKDDRRIALLDWNFVSGEVKEIARLPEREFRHFELLDTLIEQENWPDRQRFSQRAQMLDRVVWTESNPPKPQLGEIPRSEPGTRWRDLAGFPSEPLGDRPVVAEAHGIGVHPFESRVAGVFSIDDGFTWTGRLMIARPDSERGRIERQLKFHPWCCAYSPDGSVIAIGTNEGRVLLYDTEYFSQQLQFEAHESYIYAIEWTADGTLVTASGDCTLKVWDTRTPSQSRAAGEAWKAALEKARGEELTAAALQGRTGVALEAARIVLIEARYGTAPRD